ncbi:MAG: PstS family phosphate ABC transporter substrate-binding protein [Halococcoides sp.]
MTADPTEATEQSTRRAFITATGASGALALAGCLGSTDGDGPTTTESSNGMNTPESTTEAGGALPTDALTGDGSSTVFPITSDASSYWNSNPEKGDEDYWPAKWANQYGTDKRLADYFAGLYGWEATDKRSVPPFRVSIALSHSGIGIEGVMSGRVDIGDSSAPAKAELAGKDVPQSKLEKFTDHVVGVDGQPIVVSREVYDKGVTKITLGELKKIYRQEITNWSALGGPDKDILALGRAEGSGTDTAFRANVFGDPNAPISPDQRYGKNQQLQQAIKQADNAIGYIALAFVQPDGQVPPIGLEIDGTLYEYGKNLGSKDYPLSRDLHAYTWDGTSRQEAAFINMILSDFGQEFFVKANNYFALPEDRRKAQRKKVAPDNYEHV